MYRNCLHITPANCLKIIIIFIIQPAPRSWHELSKANYSVIYPIQFSHLNRVRFLVFYVIRLLRQTTDSIYFKHACQKYCADYTFVKIESKNGVMKQSVSTFTRKNIINNLDGWVLWTRAADFSVFPQFSNKYRRVRRLSIIRELGSCADVQSWCYAHVQSN